MRLLIVEDELQIAAFLERGLKEEGYAVDVVHNGNDAVDWALAVEYDGILLDVMLPGRDGYAVCRELRDQKVKTPILMLTARDAVDDRVTGLDVGADDYLTKPFAFRELVARVRALARRPRELEPSTIEIADLRVDLARHRVSRGGCNIELTAKEFALLACFVEH